MDVGLFRGRIRTARRAAAGIVDSYPRIARFRSTMMRIPRPVRSGGAGVTIADLPSGSQARGYNVIFPQIKPTVISRRVLKECADCHSCTIP